MKQKELADLTNEELLQEAKKIKTNNIYDAAIFGFLIGVAVYSAVRNGFGLLTFLPLIYVPIAAKNKIRNKEVERLVKEKGLK
ncbi:FUSC family protein [Mucilaginibacter celer]|uniref:FUSC family protein n=1 Tax=Mucilaginibacter celer TaxID=2305508 RepID=A0A494VWY5_9SPHI|nr:FUSC family protein [Mucilaginibacter celer]AYL97990.1 FUSC family protein [Mucilaginibacter celer]